MCMDRARVGVVVCVLALTTAGCVGFLTGDEPLEFSANETVAGDDALADTGYSEAGNQSIERVFNVSLGGQTRSVDTQSYLYRYNRSIPAEALADGLGPDGNDSAVSNATDDGTLADGTVVNASAPSAQFAVFTTPDPSVAGQAVNPLASLSARELVRRFTGFSGSTDLTFQGNRTVDSFGEGRTVRTYRAQPGGNETAVQLHLARFRHEGDVIVALAVHPASVEERDRVDALLAGLERLDA
jgi:hypothetical protein